MKWNVADATQGQYETLKTQLMRLYFTYVFEGVYRRPLEIEKTNADIGTTFMPGAFRVALIAFESEEMLRHHYTNVKQAFLAKEIREICFDLVMFDYEKIMLLILNYSMEQSGELATRIEKAFTVLTREEKLPACTMSLGQEKTNIAFLSDSYDDAKRYLSARLTLGINRFYSKETMQTRPFCSRSKFSYKLEQKLKSALDENDIGQIRVSTEMIIEELMKRGKTRPLEIMNGLVELLHVYRDSNAINKRSCKDLDQYFFGKEKAIEFAAEYEEIYDVFRAVIEDIYKAEQIQHQSKSDLALMQIKRYINDHFEDDVSLDDIAELVKMNPNYVCMLFKQKTGKTFKQYITEQRINAAKNLLRDHTCKIKTIAHKVGYPDERHFCKQFKKFTGKSPSEYRKANATSAEGPAQHFL